MRDGENTPKPGSLSLLIIPDTAENPPIHPPFQFLWKIRLNIASFARILRICTSLKKTPHALSLMWNCPHCSAHPGYQNLSEREHEGHFPEDV